jgi:hypothetical protein
MVAGLALVTLCWLLVMFPYMLLVKAQLGHWHWSGKAGVSLLYAEAAVDERPGRQQFLELPDDAVPESVTGYVVARPGASAWRMLINLHLLDKYVLTGLLTSGGLALVALGFLHLRFRRPPAPPEWVLALVPLPLAGLLLYLVAVRYFASLVPALSIVASIGVVRLDRPRDDNHPRRLSVRGAIALSLVLISFAPWIVRPWFRQDPGSIKKAAGLWLRQTAGPGVPFIGGYADIGYYAGSEALSSGKLPPREVVARGRLAGARFLLADNFRLPEFPPDFAALTAAGPGGSPMLELARVFEDRAGRRIFIYRIL